MKHTVSTSPLGDKPESQDQDISRRERLIVAAERLFAMRSFRAATVAEIAVEAGVSTGLLYRYFPGKTALAVAIVERDRSQTVASIMELSRLSDPMEAIERLVIGWMDVAIADRQLCALVAEISAEATRDPAIADVVRESEAEIVLAVSEWLRKSGYRDRAEPRAIALLSALDGLVARIAIDPTFDPMPTALELIRLFQTKGDGPSGVAP